MFSVNFRIFAAENKSTPTYEKKNMYSDDAASNGAGADS